MSQEEKQKETDQLLFKKLEHIMMRIKKDSSLYASEVLKVIALWEAQFIKVTENTQSKNQRFCQFTIFLCKCSIHYKGDLSFIPNSLKDLLTNYGEILNPQIRRKAVAGLMILRSKNQLDAVTTIKYLMELMNLQDKQMRKMIYSFIINDLKRLNKSHKSNKINNELQNSFFTYIQKNSDTAAKKMITMAIDLYKRNIWTQNKVVDLISKGCFNTSPKIRLISAYFLISTTEAQPEESSDDEDEVDLKDIRLKKGITKTTRFKQKLVEKEKKRAIKKLKRKAQRQNNKKFFPIDVIHNPHDFCEQLFKVMKEQKSIAKLVMMSLMARMIGRHQLIIIPFYSFLQSQMTPHQKQIGKVFTYLAESTHQGIPSDDLQPVIKHIINDYVNDRCSEMAMTMGINVIREIAGKNSQILNQDMVQYISTYYEYKNRNVSTAAKGFINAVRDINPELLERKYRGRNFIEGMVLEKPQKIATGIDGAQLLGQDGKQPVYMSRILTDEDFRMIRKLRRKKEEQDAVDQLQGKVQDQQQDQDQDLQIDQQQFEGQQDQDQSGEELQGEQFQFQDQDQEGEQLEGQQQEQDQEQGQQQDQQQDGEELDWDDVQELEGEGEFQDQEVNQSKKNNQKRKVPTKKLRQELSSDSYESDQQQDNPHGFISQNRITFYKKSKTEVKAEKRRGDDKQDKQKFVHKPKQKKGGTNNREKLKHKPLMMLRNKKNRQKLREKQIKTRIKDLKNKLGKVLSGKQAKKKKNKLLKK